MHDGTDWLEARCTQPGLLADLPVPWDTPPEGVPRFTGIFSLVVADPDLKLRALPSVYHANAHIFAHRDVNKARSRLVRTIDAVLHSEEQPSYLVTACRVDGRRGLWTRDVFNRDPFRLRAVRAGLELSDDPYVRMTPDGEFECEGWEPFRPEFVVVKSLRGPRGREAENVNKGAFLTFLFGILRVGDMGMVELHHLVSAIKDADVVAEDDPDELVTALRAAGRPRPDR